MPAAAKSRVIPIRPAAPWRLHLYNLYIARCKKWARAYRRDELPQNLLAGWLDARDEYLRSEEYLRFTQPHGGRG